MFCILGCMSVSLSAFLQAVHPLEPAVMEEFVAAFSPVQFKRKTLLTREGETQRNLYFVTEGIQRSYYLKDAKEHVIAFTYPPGFTGIPESFITQTPSKYFLECLTDSQMLRISYEKLQALVEKHRSIERLFRKATEQVLIGFIDRQYELMGYSIEERLRAFLERSPHLLGMVPQKYLASYLGIDASNFSRLLGKIRM